VPQPQLLLEGHGHHLEDAKLNPFHQLDLLLGDRPELGVLRVLLELGVVAHQMRHEVGQVDEFLLLDQCRSQFDLHDEDVRLVAALWFQNGVNHP
jgi:hypothetical protein